MAGSDISVIDVQKYVEWELAKRELPLKRLMKAEKDQEVQVSRYGNLQSLITTFSNALQTLNNTYNAVSFQTSSSNPNAVTAQVTSNNAAPITHTISVQNLAQAESQISQGFSSTTPGLSGNISIAIGSLNAGVTVSATDSLQNIRDNINSVLQAASIDASASLFSTINTDTGEPQYQLIVSSNQTGDANAVSITDGANLFGFTEQFAAQDASFTVDNQQASSPTNVVTTVLDGLSITLLPGSPSATAPIMLTVSPTDPGVINTNVTNAVQGILDSYNEIMSYIDKCQINPATSNETFPLLKLSLQEAMSKSLGNGSYQSLVSIGIVTQEAVKQTATIMVTDKNGKEVEKNVSYYSTGQLTFSTDTTIPTFSQLLQSNPNAVQALLTNTTNGIFTNIVNNLLDPALGTVSQTIRANVNILQDRETHLKQDIADEEVSLEKMKTFYTDKYAALNVLLQKLQSTSDHIYKQIEQTQVSRRD